MIQTVRHCIRHTVTEVCSVVYLVSTILTIKELSCSPLESGVTWSLLFNSSDSSWGLVRETGEAGGGGKDRLKESPLALTSSEIVSQG